MSGRWPNDADLHGIAHHAAKSVTRLDISQQEIYEYLSRVALGSERLDDVFSIEGIGTIPLFATANLLLKFGPQDKEWWEYLRPDLGGCRGRRAREPVCPARPNAPRPRGKPR